MAILKVILKDGDVVIPLIYYLKIFLHPKSIRQCLHIPFVSGWEAFEKELSIQENSSSD